MISFCWCIFGAFICYHLIKWLLSFPKVSDYNNKYILITGCDSGFGHLLAKRLDQLGFNVFAACLTDKGADDTKKSASSRLVTLSPVDVTSEESIQKAFQEVKSKLPADKGLWAIVNNAGIAGSLGCIEWFTRKDYDSVFAVNVFGVIDVTKIFLPLLRKSRGRVVNTASVFGRLAMAPCPYTISKYGVEAFSDCLRRDVYHQGISVHIIEPGYFKTNILSNLHEKFRSKFSECPKEVQEYYGREFVDKAKEKIDFIMDNIASPDVHKVVNAYVHAITAKFPKYRYLVGNDAHFFFRPLWNLPEWLTDWILTYNLAKPAGAV